MRADTLGSGAFAPRSRAVARPLAFAARTDSRREADLSDSLLLAVSQGDSRAINACLDKYSGLVWSIARRMSPNETDAEDAVQEIFIDLWKSAHRFDPGRSSEKTFVVMIARRRLIDRLRRHQRQPEFDSLDHENAPELGSDAHNRLERDTEARLAAEALDQLRPEQRRLVELSVLKGIPHGEISESTGIPLGTVKSHIRRGLIALREALDVPSPPPPARGGGASSTTGTAGPGQLRGEVE